MPRFDPEQALINIEKFKVTHSQWVPTMFVRLLKLPDAVREKYDVSSLKIAIHAAAPCPIEVKQRMIAWWGPILQEYYAATEDVRSEERRVGNECVRLCRSQWSGESKKK